MDNKVKDFASNLSNSVYLNLQIKILKDAQNKAGIGLFCSLFNLLCILFQETTVDGKLLASATTLQPLFQFLSKNTKKVKYLWMELWTSQ